MKKFAYIFLTLCILTSNVTFAKCNCTPQCNCFLKKVTNDEMYFYKNYAEQVKKERAAVSNALQLTEEQVKCKLEITRSNDCILEEKYRSLYKETLKLNALKEKETSRKLINEQENIVTSIKKEINTVIDNENKQFKKILDREQRAKLKMIQKLQRKTIKDLDKQKDYYKSNPKMRPFAYPVKTNCGCK